jgi:hypothetical protein
LAVSEAFHAARRELQDYVRRRRGYVKAPSRSPARGQVVKAADSALGFAATEDSEDESG